MESNQDTKGIVDISPLLEDLTLKVHTVSQQQKALVKTMNDLYFKLDVLSEVLEQVTIIQNISTEEYVQLVDKAIGTIKTEWQETAKHSAQTKSDECLMSSAE